MKYRKHMFVCVAAGGAVATAASSAWALDLSLTTNSNGTGPLELATLLTLITLAPALLIMLTSFTRIVIVLSLLRQALGLQQTPPNIVITGLALFLTMLVMAPTWTRIQQASVEPYVAGKLSEKDAVANAEGPLRDFMLRQTRVQDIEMARGLVAKGNAASSSAPSHDLPFYALVPAFVSSELTSAFRVGFLIFLPFLVIDLVVSAVLMGLGMFMLPPSVITIPLKLLIFVLVSGWPLLLANLAASFS